MHYASLLALAAAAQAVSTGFNYGNMMSDGYTAKSQDDYEAEFKRAQSLTGTAGKAGEFTSARLYTMIEGGTSDTPISAIQAAINTKTTLLLGLWASVDQDTFQNELNALNAAIEQWGDDFTSLVVGISVGSEDLYRITPTGIENDAGIGADPDTIVSYIKQTRSVIQGTGLSGASIGHVDTWTAWVNGSNSAVVDNCDWLGMDTYPYFQSTVDNSIENANKTFWDAFDATAGSGNGKDVWITETGWPVSGKTVNQAVPSLQNAESYWQDVACSTIGKYNTWWYTLQDASPTTPNPSFGIVGSNLASSSLYDLTCKAQPKPAKSTQSGGPSSHATATGAHGSNSTGGASGNGGSDSASSAIGATPTGSAASASASASGSASGSQTGGATQVGSAFGAAVLVVFGLVAAL